MSLIEIILASGRSVVNIALYTLLPVMVLMMALMRLLEKKGVLAWLARMLSKPLAFFGLPGIGVFAMLQLTFVSFAAPIATLKILDGDSRIDKRHLAATFAMVVTMSQANALFPLAALGLKLGFTLLTSFLAGLLAAVLAYYVFTPKDNDHLQHGDIKVEKVERDHGGLLPILTAGGEEGMHMVFKAVPMLLISLLIVNIIRELGLIEILSDFLNGPLSAIGVPGIAVLPIFTKFVAGGTAMMGITIELVQEGALTAVDLNRIAGFIINPFDLIGIGFLSTAGPRTSVILKPALGAAAVAILIRAIVHLVVM